MKNLLDNLETLLNEARQSGQPLFGINFVGKYGGAEEPTAWPAILIGQLPERLKKNAGNKRKLIEATLLIHVVALVGRRTEPEAIEDMREWSDKVTSYFQANSTLDGAALKIWATQSDPGLSRIADNEVAIATITLIARYSEYPGA